MVIKVAVRRYYILNVVVGVQIMLGCKQTVVSAAHRVDCSRMEKMLSAGVPPSRTWHLPSSSP